LSINNKLINLKNKNMKKLLFVFAIAAFASCNNATETPAVEAAVENAVEAVDSSAAAAVDSAAAVVTEVTTEAAAQ
jgi:hypothetical protein